MSREPDKCSKYNRISAFERIIASTIGGTITALAVTPMDVVKTRLQAQPQAPVNGTGGRDVSQVFKLRYRGTVDAFMKIGRQEGVFALWRGLGPSVAMTVPSTTIYFALYEFFKGELEDRAALGDWTPLVAGASGRAIAVAATSPLDLFRTNLQSHSREIGATQLFREILKSGRWTTFWVGVRPTLWRDVPFSGIYWMCYEAIRRDLSRTRLITSNYLTSLTAGAIAGSIAGVLTLPFDVLKTRAQMNVDRIATHSLSPDHLPSSTWHHMAQICSQEGIRSLFQGLLPRIGKVAPACAIMISSYELVKDFFLSKRNSSSTHTSLARRDDPTSSQPDHNSLQSNLSSSKAISTTNQTNTTSSSIPTKSHSTLGTPRPDAS